MLLLQPAYWSAQGFKKSYNVFVYGPEFARLTIIGDQGGKACTQDLPEEKTADLNEPEKAKNISCSKHVVVANNQINF